MILCGGIGGLNVHQKPHTGGCFPDCGKDLGAKAPAPLVLCHGKVDDMHHVAPLQGTNQAAELLPLPGGEDLGMARPVVE